MTSNLHINLLLYSHENYFVSFSNLFKFEWDANQVI